MMRRMYPRRLHDLELAFLDRDPGPTRAKLAGAGRSEVRLELVVAAEIAVECLLQLAGQVLAADALLHPFPEMDVIVVLRGVVEEPGILAVGLLYDLFQRTTEALATPVRLAFLVAAFGVVLRLALSARPRSTRSA